MPPPNNSAGSPCWQSRNDWRGLSELDKADLDVTKALQLMLTHPALIKRPLLEINGTFHLGFNQQQYQQIIQSL